MTDHGPSDCGEPMWIYGSPEPHDRKRHSGFETNQSRDKDEQARRTFRNLITHVVQAKPNA